MKRICMLRIRKSGTFIDSIDGQNRTMTTARRDTALPEVPFHPFISMPSGKVAADAEKKLFFMGDFDSFGRRFALPADLGDF